MLKIIICLILLTVVEVSRNGIFAVAITTPLLAKLQPQPSLAPADTEHAGYVEALTPILHTTPLITTAALFPAAVTTVQHLPYVYPGKYNQHNPIMNRQTMLTAEIKIIAIAIGAIVLMVATIITSNMLVDVIHYGN
ncbi:hypothetical protein GQX74_002806 [Glossina fuscipes]|nr:hypothetical protein GQX74_002806 [Glossina fuscipes]